jgi:hypothetical protein
VSACPSPGRACRIMPPPFLGGTRAIARGVRRRRPHSPTKSMSAALCALLVPLAEAGDCEPLPSSLAPLARPGQRRASLAPPVGARFPDARDPFLGAARAIARGVRRRRRHSPTKSTSARSSSARRCAISRRSRPSCFSNTNAGSVDDFATFPPGAEGLQGLGEDVGRLLVGAALLDVGEVGFVRLDLRRWRWIQGIEVRW